MYRVFFFFRLKAGNLLPSKKKKKSFTFSTAPNGAMANTQWWVRGLQVGRAKLFMWSSATWKDSAWYIVAATCGDESGDDSVKCLTPQ